MLSIICKKMKESDFEGIQYRKIRNIEDYEALRKEVEEQIIISDSINYAKLINVKIHLNNRIDELESSKEMSISIFLPVVIIIPGVVLSLIVGYFLIDGIWGICDAVCTIIFLLAMMIFLIVRSLKINEIKRNDLLFHNTIKEILDKTVTNER